MGKLLHRSTLLVDSDVVIFLRRPAPHGGDPSAAARLEPNPVLGFRVRVYRVGFRV